MIEGLIAALIFMSAAAGVFARAAFVQMNKVEELENAIEVYYKRTDYVIKFMREIDNRQIFESDDEVGEAFSQLVFAVNDLEQYIGEREIDEITTKGEEN